jgi:hypothetical protein
MIAKKAPAFLGTPPGEGGGGWGKGERRGGESPGLHAPGAKRNGGSLGIPLRSGAERRTLAAAGGSSPLTTLPRSGGVERTLNNAKEERIWNVSRAR